MKNEEKEKAREELIKKRNELSTLVYDLGMTLAIEPAVESLYLSACNKLVSVSKDLHKLQTDLLGNE